MEENVEAHGVVGVEVLTLDEAEHDYESVEREQDDP